MEAIVLGCGTSHGVPMIACSCRVCRSDDPKNRRTRCALYVTDGKSALLVDAPPELRLQLTRERIMWVDAVLLTHSHADHVMGLDDVRRFNELTGTPMPVYGRADTLADVRRIFAYAFSPPPQKGGGVPSFDLRVVEEELVVGEMRFRVFPVWHGRLEVLGIRIGGFAYVTDVSEIPAESWMLLQGVDTLVLDATRRAPHPTHFHFDRAVEVAQKIGARQTYLTHLTHDYDFERTNRELPDGVSLAWDGLRIPVQP
jgi:phosphoribosyl 1,2-cyclic phosphate phosphodiesterase